MAPSYHSQGFFKFRPINAENLRQCLKECNINIQPHEPSSSSNYTDIIKWFGFAPKKNLRLKLQRLVEKHIHAKKADVRSKRAKDEQSVKETSNTGENNADEEQQWREKSNLRTRSASVKQCVEVSAEKHSGDKQQHCNVEPNTRIRSANDKQCVKVKPNTNSKLQMKVKSQNPLENANIGNISADDDHFVKEGAETGKNNTVEKQQHSVKSKTRTLSPNDTQYVEVKPNAKKLGADEQQHCRVESNTRIRTSNKSIEVNQNIEKHIANKQQPCRAESNIKMHTANDSCVKMKPITGEHSADEQQPCRAESNTRIHRTNKKSVEVNENIDKQIADKQPCRAESNTRTESNPRILRTDKKSVEVNQNIDKHVADKQHPCRAESNTKIRTANDKCVKIKPTTGERSTDEQQYCRIERNTRIHTENDRPCVKAKLENEKHRADEQQHRMMEPNTRVCSVNDKQCIGVKLSNEKHITDEQQQCRMEPSATNDKQCVESKLESKKYSTDEQQPCRMEPNIGTLSANKNYVETKLNSGKLSADEQQHCRIEANTGEQSANDKCVEMKPNSGKHSEDEKQNCRVEANTRKNDSHSVQEFTPKSSIGENKVINEEHVKVKSNAADLSVPVNPDEGPNDSGTSVKTKQVKAKSVGEQQLAVDSRKIEIGPSMLESSADENVSFEVYVIDADVQNLSIGSSYILLVDETVNGNACFSSTSQNNSEVEMLELASDTPRVIEAIPCQILPKACNNEFLSQNSEIKMPAFKRKGKQILRNIAIGTCEIEDEDWLKMWDGSKLIPVEYVDPLSRAFFNVEPNCTLISERYFPWKAVAGEPTRITVLAHCAHKTCRKFRLIITVAACRRPTLHVFSNSRDTMHGERPLSRRSRGSKQKKMDSDAKLMSRKAIMPRNIAIGSCEIEDENWLKMWDGSKLIPVKYVDPLSKAFFNVEPNCTLISERYLPWKSVAGEPTRVTVIARCAHKTCRKFRILITVAEGSRPTLHVFTNSRLIAHGGRPRFRPRRGLKRKKKHADGELMNHDANFEPVMNGNTQRAESFSASKVGCTLLLPTRIDSNEFHGHLTRSWMSLGSLLMPLAIGEALVESLIISILSDFWL